MQPNSAITELQGVGDGLAKKFKVLGIVTIEDLIHHYPRRYDDYSLITSIAQLRPGIVTIQAVISHATGRYVRRGMHITEAIASDETGSVRLIWFNQPYRAAALKSGQAYYLTGVYELRRGRFAIMNPNLEKVSDMPLNTARIVAVYRETKGLRSQQIRAAINQALSVVAELPESLPGSVMSQNKLMSRQEALRTLHVPDSMQLLEQSQRRLGFEEVFQLSLASLLNKQANQTQQAVTIPFDQKLARDFVKHLAFTLTNAQRKTIWQIYQDMQKPQPMNRLVEGDVGSGKTVVAAMAALMVMAQGKQVALMAPTELLARQHAETLHTLLRPLGYSERVVLLVGSLTAAQKKRAHQAIQSGKGGFIVGTQALIQDKVDMHSLALAIIDEQHRFGVEQRKLLMSKAGHMPHVLSLTATPIPRSLALTLYGELDISLLDEKPANRQSVTTEIVSPNSRAQLYEKINTELTKGRQMFVVCPLITESSSQAATSAESAYQQLQTGALRHHRIGLLHGKMPAQEKQAMMTKFVNHELDILVATTVIEVGVDVPNASIMIIEDAERFGLAQLHQLRGRIGRGAEKGYCYLMLSDSQPPSRRLRALTTSHDGFKLAELDLELRGPGAIYGVSQHGQLDLRIAKLTDTQLIASARVAAQGFIDSGDDLLQYPELASRVAHLRTVTNLN